MKILRVSLTNIASFSDRQDIDFTAEPLASANLYAIHGPTGSGKSTILDAICLALYNTTPRIKNPSVDGRVVVDSNDPKIKQADPRTLLRRNAASGHIEVCFLASDGLTYTSHWQTYRARRKSDGQLQNETITLYAGNVTMDQAASHPPIASGKKTEVLARIESLIGLEFEQFTRAVLLAQNDFAAFLKAKGEDRASILQALTNTSIFNKISRKISERSSQCKRELEQLDAIIAHAKLLSPEARASLQADSEAKRDEIAKLEESGSSMANRRRWLLHKRELEANLAAAREIFETESTRQKELQPLREQVSLASKFLHEAQSFSQQQASHLKQAADARANHANLAQARPKLEASLASLASAIDTSARQAEAATRKLEQAKPEIQQASKLDAGISTLDTQLAALAPQIDDADKQTRDIASKLRKTQATHTRLENQMSSRLLDFNQAPAFHPLIPQLEEFKVKLRDWETARNKLEKLTADQRKDSQKLARLNQKLEESTPKLEKLKAELASARKSHETFTAILKSPEVKSLPNARRDLTAAQQLASSWKLAIQSLTPKRTEFQRLSETVSGLEASISRETLNQGKLGPAIESAQLKSENFRQAFEQASAAVGKQAAALRTQLVSSCPCPVCGSCDHPYSHEIPDADSAALKSLKQNRNAADKELETLRNNHAACTTRIETLNSDLKTHQSSLAAAQATLEAQIQSNLKLADPFLYPSFPLPELARAEWNSYPDPQMDTIIGNWLSSLKALSADLSARESAAETTRNHQAEAARSIDTLNISIGKVTDANAQIHQEIAALQGVSSQRSQDIQTAEVDLASNHRQLHPIIQAIQPESPGLDATVPDRAWYAHIASAIDKIANLANLKAEIAKLSIQIEPLPEQLAELNRQLADASAKLSSLDKRRGELDTNIQNSRAERAKLLGGLSVDEFRDQAEREITAAKNHKESLTAQHQEAGNQLATLDARIKSASDSAKTHQTAASEAGKNLDSWFILNPVPAPLSREDFIATFITSPSGLSRSTDELAKADAARDKASGSVDSHSKQLQDHLTAEDAAPLANEAGEILTAESLATQIRENTELLKAARERFTELNANLIADTSAHAANAKTIAQREACKKSSEPWFLLNQHLGSADGMKFTKIAQSFTLDHLLEFANYQLQTFAPRYSLFQVDDNLSLAVTDNDLDNKPRSVHTLSGGESFLVSLALSLALANLTSNRMRIESLFIDEGFGSLDSATLGTVMRALASLQSQGRKVGVISHVTEMAEAISPQIVVTPHPSRSSTISVR